MRSLLILTAQIPDASVIALARWIDPAKMTEQISHKD